MNRQNGATSLNVNSVIRSALSGWASSPLFALSLSQAFPPPALSFTMSEAKAGPKQLRNFFELRRRDEETRMHHYQDTVLTDLDRFD